MEHAKLDALIYGKLQCVSFRHASALFSIPTRSAQELLLSYIRSQPPGKLSVLWIVSRRDQRTDALKTLLTTSPSPTDRKQVWAVGPATASSAPSPHAAWIADDTKRERDLVRRPSHEPNELRDGRFNVFKSSTFVFDQRIDPRLSGDASLVNKNSMEKKTTSTSFLSMVKAKTKAKSNKQAPFAFKKAANNPGSSSNLFSLKPLGADSIRKIKAEEKINEKEPNSVNNKSSSAPAPSGNASASKPSKAGSQDRRKRKNGKKARKIVVQADSDGEDNNSDEEMDEEHAQIVQLEREAAEQERAAEERAELERELMDLQDKKDNEPKPALQDMDSEMKDVESEPHEDVSDSAEKVDNSPNKAKRSFWDTLNHAPPNGRRIRKEVQELVEENGYYVTKRVIKVYDENGKEVPDEAEKDIKKAEEEKKKKMEESSASLRQLFTPPKTNSVKRAKSGRGNGKPPKPSSPSKPGRKKNATKLKNTSIHSYFQKKV